MELAPTFSKLPPPPIDVYPVKLKRNGLVVRHWMTKSEKIFKNLNLLITIKNIKDL